MVPWLSLAPRIVRSELLSEFEMTLRALLSLPWVEFSDFWLEHRRCLVERLGDLDLVEVLSRTFRLWWPSNLGFDFMGRACQILFGFFYLVRKMAHQR